MKPAAPCPPSSPSRGRAATGRLTACLAVLLIGLAPSACGRAATPAAPAWEAAAGDGAPGGGGAAPGGSEDTDRIPPVVFSVARGVFDAPTRVALSVDAPGATIRFTTDGGEPTESRGAVYTSPIEIAATTVLRAAAWAAGGERSPVASHTYILPDAVARQPAAPAGLPATWGNETAVYAVTPRHLGGADPAAAVAAALGSLPSLSLAADPADLFDAERGIYADPEARGPEWERPISAEWLPAVERAAAPPAAAAESPAAFQVDAGLRVQGHWNRDPDKTPKHSLRLVFRGEYGPGELAAPLFAGPEANRFNTLTLRGGFNDSWLVDVAGQRDRALYVRDAWTRATQRAMGWASPRGAFVHLYLNGLYWGVYEVVERPDDAFAAEHLGGARELYDVLQHGELIAGESDDWHAMLALARAGVATEASHRALERVLDLDNLIDYMLVYLYTADDDWPKRNWYAARRRAPGARWQFFAWDGERGLVDAARDIVAVQGGDNPSLPYHHLRVDSPEFRLRFADHARRHLLSPGGALYVCSGRPEWQASNPGCNVPAARFARLAADVEPALAAESARWGAYRRPERPYAPEGDWRVERERLLAEYFPVRTAVLLDQLRAAGLYPALDAPNIGIDPERYGVDMFARRGDVFYTTDGTDPRVPFTGAVAPGAVRFTVPIPVAADGATLVRARARDGDTWSALTEAVHGVPSVRITELMYHPADDWPEFVELANVGAGPAPLYHPGAPGRPWRLAGGVRYAIPYGTVIPPGGRLVVAGEWEPEAFRARYTMGDAAPVLGPFAGKLDNAGEDVALIRPVPGFEVWEEAAPDAYVTVDAVRYRDGGAWPSEADGDGPSLERVDPDGPGDDPASWRAGARAGTPGR